MVTNVTDSDFDEVVLQSEKPVLVDFWADWCGPCKSMMPTVDRIDNEYSHVISVVKMNIDENDITPRKYGVRSIPNLKLFKNGKVIDEMVGGVPFNRLKEMIEDIL